MAYNFKVSIWPRRSSVTPRLVEWDVSISGVNFTFQTVKEKHDAGVGTEKMSSRMRSREKNVDGKGKNCRGEKKRNWKGGRGVDGSGRVKKRLFPTKKIYILLFLSVMPSVRSSVHLCPSRPTCLTACVYVLVCMCVCLPLCYTVGAKGGWIRTQSSNRSHEALLIVLHFHLYEHFKPIWRRDMSFRAT